jgi:hypothetical protein
VQSDFHDRLECTYNPVLKRIQFLVEKGLT